MPVAETICTELVFTRRILPNKYANHLHDSVWETLAQRGEIIRTCALFEAYTGELAWNSVGDKLKGPCYLSRDDHDLNIKTRKQRTNIGKYVL